MPIYLLACSAFASLLVGATGWEGPFRIWVGVYRQIFFEPLRGLAASHLAWDCLYLSILFAGLVFGACLRAELRTFRFLKSQNITRVFGGGNPDPNTDFRIKVGIYAAAALIYVLGQAAAAHFVLCGSGAPFWYLLYIPVTYAGTVLVLIRQVRRRDVEGLPLFSRGEAIGVICVPWTIVAPVLILALADGLSQG